MLSSAARQINYLFLFMGPGDHPAPLTATRFIPDLLELGDEVAVRATTRNQARQIISGECGVDYVQVHARKRYMRECACEECEEIGPAKTHGYDSFWIFCEKTDEGAVEWWVG